MQLITKLALKGEAVLVLYFSEEVMQLMWVEFLDFTYLFSSCLSRDLCGTAVQQHPQAVQPKTVD